MSDEIRCPKCGSTNIHTDKNGFSIKKSLVGGLLVGTVGLLGGAFGSNKIRLTCLNCGHTFKPGEKRDDDFMRYYTPTTIESSLPHVPKPNKPTGQRVRITTLLKYRDVIKESKVELLEALQIEGREYVIVPNGEIEHLCRLQNSDDPIKRIVSFRECD